jgi:hypothetical protein
MVEGVTERVKSHTSDADVSITNPPTDAKIAPMLGLPLMTWLYEFTNAADVLMTRGLEDVTREIVLGSSIL